MEKLLAPAKSTYLLEAPLEILHEESLEWLEEIEFWKDETAFFYALIIKRTKDSAVWTTKQAKEVERHLVYVSAERLDDLRLEVKNHEKFLNRILNNSQLSEEYYRIRHKEITEKMQNFEWEYRSMKKKIFTLTKKQK